MEQDSASLAYTLKEVEVAVRMMFKNRSVCHAFDLGKTPDGSELCMVLSIVPKETVELIENSLKAAADNWLMKKTETTVMQ